MALASVLAICIGYLPYQVYGPGGVKRTLRLEHDMAKLLEGNDRLQRSNRTLRQQIRSLKQDRAYIEQVARDELGMVRPMDIVFQFRR